MKNKKLATLVAIPLALSFSLGISACSAPADSTKAPVAQEQAVDVATMKANASETMDSLKMIFLEPETAKALIEASNNFEDLDFEKIDSDDKIWNQISPFLGFPIDDATLVKYVFGDKPSAEETPKAAKVMVIGLLMGSFFDVTPGLQEDPNLDKLAKYAYAFTSTKTLADGTIQPKNQAMVLKDKNDAIIDVRVGFESLGFTKDGKKLMLEMAPLIESKSSAIYSSMQSDAISAAKEIETYFVAQGSDSAKSKISKAKIEKYINDTVNLSEENVMDFVFNEKDETYMVTIKNDDLKVVYDSANGGIQSPEPSEEISEEEDVYTINLMLEVARSVGELDSKTIDKLMKDPSSYAKSVEDSEEPEEVTKIITASEISEDKSKLKATIEGTVYWFAITK